MSEPEGFDDLDGRILDGVRDLHDLLDPPPPDLADRVLFAMALANLDAEVARLQEDQLIGSGARGTERTRTISFDAETLTIMVTLVEMPDGLLRIDGWLGPAAPWRVELRLSDAAGAKSSLVVTADEGGRFVFPTVAHGLAQLVVHRDAGEARTDVVTPAVLL
ncbi:hypothetical protein F4553_006054 [Allocatelliglobosispora scoriae]|uniref:Carboxypeptidase regulatory-like domain-containing protein n=1 Tax=Allocatelliglobosispora scoriae TaxID=643052 RepID=A0A841C0X7_9ACTN|nr:carboxypeptidase regulatory-like domain-containing protein [Allocatelliglobosispora scoriae]MBB5872620.1 hypothetical protein [Allocatelliglobosispora scoriae]